MNVKESYYAFLDKWDAFLANKFQTHLACGCAGVVIGFALAQL